MPLSARVSLPAQRIIKEAFEDLERTISASDRVNLKDTTLDNVRQAAYYIEDQLAARQSLRNMRRLMPLFAGLEHYSRSIEVLCNGTPYLPWIWAPIKLILTIASDYVEAFEKIIKAYARIAEPLARFKVLDRTYSTHLDMQQTLAIFYADILKFHKHAYEFVRRSGWKVFFTSSWCRFQRRFDSIIEDLKAHEDLVDKTANAINISEAREMREKLEVWRQENLDKLAKDEAEQTAAQYLAIVGWLKLDEFDQIKIFESIELDTSNNSGACDWILKQQKISAWMRCSQEASFLVLHGHPGTGKSVLSTQIANFLKSDGHSLVITHFCTYSYATSKNYEQILRSILTQLIRSNTDLVAHVYEELILKKTTPNSQVLEQLLRDLVGAASLAPSKIRYIHIIVDGLDECDNDKQVKTINMLERIVSTAFSSVSTVCKVLLSTRISQAIMKKLKHKQTVSLSDERDGMEKAIKHYAAERLGSLRARTFQMGINDADLEDMAVRITEKAAGMFLWARLVLDYLATNMFFSRDEILRAADTLPRKLSEFYGQILTQLTSHFDDRSVARMKLILGWIAFAKRPLRKAEFRSALAFSTGDLDVIELAPPYIFDICAPLIEERRDSTFAFIHVSVKEFLQSPDSNVILNEETALYEQGLATVTCLLSGVRIFAPSYPEQTRSIRVLRGLHGFHIYATEYWIEYLLSNAASSNGMDTSSKFFFLSCELSHTLKHIPVAPAGGKDDESFLLLDNRLAHLQHYGDLYEIARTLLLKQRSRCLAELDSDNDITTNLVEITSLESLLFNYQYVIKKLINKRSYSGVSFPELEKFKQEYRTAAFTCRLWPCPRAAAGFNNDDLRLAHEASHRRIICGVPGCQYPPFLSSRSLKEHHAKCHGGKVTDLKRTTIKKFPGSILRLSRNTEAVPAERPHHRKSHLLRTLRGHSGPVNSVAFSPSDSMIASGSADTTVRLWDADTGQLLNTLVGHLGAVKSVAFSPRYGSLVASGSVDMTVRLWNTAGQLLKKFTGHSRIITTVAFWPRDSNMLVSSALENVILLWDVTASSQPHPLTGHSAGISSLAFSPDGRLMASSSLDQTIYLWDTISAKRLHQLLLRAPVYTVVFSPDSKVIASGTMDRMIRLWNVDTAEQLLEFVANPVGSMAFSPNGRMIASGSLCGAVSDVRLWDAITGQCLWQSDNIFSVSNTIAFSPKRMVIASGSGDKTVRLWQTAIEVTEEWIESDIENVLQMDS